MEIRDNLFVSSASKVTPQELKNLQASVFTETSPNISVAKDSVDIRGKKDETMQTLSPVKKEKFDDIAESPQAETTVAPKEKGIEEVPLFDRDLYKIAHDGKATKVTFIYDPGGRECLKNLRLAGSWDKNTGKYTTEWKNSFVPMERMEDGRFKATITITDDQPHDWRWGVFADAPTGKDQWAIFEEGSLKFDPNAKNKEFIYAPTNYHQMGAYKEGEDINFRYWAPYALDVQVKVWGDDPKNPTFLPMEKDPETGMWFTKVKGGWKDMLGKNYMYSIKTPEGKTVERLDPYARDVQGIQRGTNTIYIHKKTGQPVHQFWYEDGKPAFIPLTRFEVQDQPDAEVVYLKLMDENGNVMKKEDLLKRLGPFDDTLIDKFHNGKLNDFYTRNIDDQGRIKMTKQGRAWATILNNQDNLVGLRYQFEVYKKDENGQLQLVGDINKDGILQENERKATAFNDPYDNEIHPNFGWARAGIITDPKAFEWKNDNVPRMTTDQRKYIIYQLHVGSIFGDANNVDRSTFKDVIKRLEYFKDLGVNTLELLPTNMTENTRDWGYIGTNTFAQTDNYGFVDDDGRWVSGTEAMKRFVDAAHGMGFNVINDVVYNHFGGAFNHVWESDSKRNPWFDWDQNHKPSEPGTSLFKSFSTLEADANVNPKELRGVVSDAMPSSYRVQSGSIKSVSKENDLFKALKHTDWGALPAFNQKAVRDFVINNVMMQFDELHVDGLRFDFTHPIHDANWGGGADGWNMLRKINREVHFFYPNATTSAEEFPNSPIITKPAGPDGSGGAGFNHEWNTEFQHRLVHTHHGASILQAAARGWRTNIDHFMDALINHPGFDTWMNSITIISNHDEVGNAERTIAAAEGDRIVDMPSQWGRSAARLTFGVGMLAPGIPMYFQGEESLAKNQFKWGIPSTWDIGWKWLDIGKDINWNNITFNQSQIDLYDRLLAMSPEQRENDPAFKALSPDNRKVFDYLASQKPEDLPEAKYNIARRTHHTFCKDITALRKSSPAFDGDAEINRVYTHNDNSIMAFHRKKGNEEFIVIGSLNRNNMENYSFPVAPGKWKLVFNSDAPQYGGNGFGYGKPEVYGSMNTSFDIPAGGLLVYKKVG